MTGVSPGEKFVRIYRRENGCRRRNRLESALWDAYVSQTRQRNRTVTEKAIRRSQEIPVSACRSGSRCAHLTSDLRQPHRHQQVIRGLQVHPELRRGLEVERKPESGIGGDRAFPLRDLVDAARGDVQIHRQFVPANAQRRRNSSVRISPGCTGLSLVMFRFPLSSGSPRFQRYARRRSTQSRSAIVRSSRIEYWPARFPTSFRDGCPEEF